MECQSHNRRHRGRLHNVLPKRALCCVLAYVRSLYKNHGTWPSTSLVNPAGSGPNTWDVADAWPPFQECVPGVAEGQLGPPPAELGSQSGTLGTKAAGLGVPNERESIINYHCPYASTAYEYVLQGRNQVYCWSLVYGPVLGGSQQP